MPATLISLPREAQLDILDLTDFETLKHLHHVNQLFLSLVTKDHPQRPLRDYDIKVLVRHGNLVETGFPFYGCLDFLPSKTFHDFYASVSKGWQSSGFLDLDTHPVPYAFANPNEHRAVTTKCNQR